MLKFNELQQKEWPKYSGLCTPDKGVTYTYIYSKGNESTELSIYGQKGRIKTIIVHYLMKSLVRILHSLKVFTKTRLSPITCR